MIRKVLRFIVRLLFKLLSRVEVVGMENVPPSGGCILACNHVSRLDPVLVFALIERTDITALVADKYKKHLIFSALINAVGGIWLHREDADFHALREARSFLQSGGLLGIAPEGTRSRTRCLSRGRSGVAYLADKSGVQIVPAAIYGTETAILQLFRFHRPLIHIQFSAPFTLPALQRGERDISLQRNTDEIMCRIAALLPPQYRGVYADHPRLKELLAVQTNATLTPEASLIAST
jgi:1-acyl-sn-glycerol-3-phosphate acyltransferase